jgi:activating signal cointegrator 1
MTTRPPALAIWRPWPNLMFYAGKDPENRTWSTHYRGLLLIHAAKGTDPAAMTFAQQIGQGIADGRIPACPQDHPVGIVGVAELYDVCAWSIRHPDQQCPTCPLWAAKNQYHWRLRDAAAFPQPIAHPGKQKLWAVNPDIWPAVFAQLKAVGRA